MPLPLLLVILALLVAGAAPAAILQKGSQIVNLVVPLQHNNGNVPFSDLYIRNSDGSVTPFVLPPNTVLIISKVAWNFTLLARRYRPVAAQPGRILPDAGPRLTIIDCSGNDSILPGVAVTNMSARIFLEQVGDPDRTPIPGTLSMRLVCYTAPDN